MTRDDLVGQYVGHTALKTREVLKRAMGGVLALTYGARWEDDELVTYDMKTLRLGLANEADDFINDND